MGRQIVFYLLEKKQLYGRVIHIRVFDKKATGGKPGLASLLVFINIGLIFSMSNSLIGSME